jgi:hypothetical protein
MLQSNASLTPRTIIPQPIGYWNVSQVSNFASMFSGADDFNQPLAKWDVRAGCSFTEVRIEHVGFVKSDIFAYALFINHFYL